MKQVFPRTSALTCCFSCFKFGASFQRSLSDSIRYSATMPVGRKCSSKIQCRKNCGFGPAVTLCTKTLGLGAPDLFDNPTSRSVEKSDTSIAMSSIYVLRLPLLTQLQTGICLRQAHDPIQGHQANIEKTPTPQVLGSNEQLPSL